MFWGRGIWDYLAEVSNKEEKEMVYLKRSRLLLSAPHEHEQTDEDDDHQYADPG